MPVSSEYVADALLRLLNRAVMPDAYTVSRRSLDSEIVFYDRGAPIERMVVPLGNREFLELEDALREYGLRRQR